MSEKHTSQKQNSARDALLTRGITFKSVRKQEGQMLLWGFMSVLNEPSDLKACGSEFLEVIKLHWQPFLKTKLLRSGA